MRFSLSWLKSYLNTSASLEVLAQGLTDCGLEVEHIEDYAWLDTFLIGKIVELKPHPQADRLQCCVVETQQGLFHVVCGDPLIYVGLVSIFAPVGTFIPGLNRVLKQAKIRGVESQGMLCSGQELGLDVASEGILQLPSQTLLQEAVRTVFERDDPVFDIAVTPNRPDCFGVKGIARDLAAKGLGVFINDQTPLIVENQNLSPSIQVKERALAACPFILMRALYDVNVKAPCPPWLKKRLTSVGAKMHSLPIDVTNYLCFDRARPLHAYDLEKISGQMCVRLSHKGELFEGLDGKTYTLPDDLCVIADDQGILALAGIMGGMRACVQETTQHILLESAFFAKEWVARAGQATHILSESRTRFERGVDPESLLDGLNQATEFILSHAGGQAGILFSFGSPPPRKTISFRHEDFQRSTNVFLEEKEAREIGNKLGFVWDKDTIIVPSFRPDVTLSCDIVEEILRIKGVDIICPTPLPACPKRAIPFQESLKEKARTCLMLLGFLETVTWSFISDSLAQQLIPLPAERYELVHLKNPISLSMETMRPSLLGGLLSVAARNKAYKSSSMALFEMGSVFYLDTETGLPTQHTSLAGIRLHKACLDMDERHWFFKERDVTAFDAKRDSVTLFKALLPQKSFVCDTHVSLPWFHPGSSGRLSLKQTPDESLGYFGKLHPQLLKKVELDGLHAVGFEIHFQKLCAACDEQTIKNKYKKNAWTLPLYQKVVRDFAFVVDKKISSETLKKAAYKGSHLIASLVIFDIFEHPSLGEGKKSVGLEVTLQPTQGTLTHEEIEAISQKIIASVTSSTGAVLRDAG